MRLLVCATLAFATAIIARPASAVITTTVLVVLGTELEPKAGREAAENPRRLEGSQLRILASPSIWSGDKPPKLRYFVGRVIGSNSVAFGSTSPLVLLKNATPNSVMWPLPVACTVIP